MYSGWICNNIACIFFLFICLQSTQLLHPSLQALHVFSFISFAFKKRGRTRMEMMGCVRQMEVDGRRETHTRKYVSVRSRLLGSTYIGPGGKAVLQVPTGKSQRQGFFSFAFKRLARTFTLTLFLLFYLLSRDLVILPVGAFFSCLFFSFFDHRIRSYTYQFSY